MAGTNPKKQLLTLICSFATENSQGKRRVVSLKKQIEELQLELDAANAERDEAKRCKETTEQELKGYEVQVALNNTAFQTLDSRISSIQDEISTVGSEGENEEGALRDGFISQIYELNAKISTFQKSMALNFRKEYSSVGTAAEAEHSFTKKEFTEALITHDDMQADVVSQTAKEEKEYLKEENIQMQVQLELTDLERKVSLMEMIVEETKSLQNSDLEQKTASIGSELQKRCICPSCNKENAERLGGILKANGAH